MRQVLLVRSLFAIAALTGSGIAVSSLGQDVSPETVLPPLPGPTFQSPSLTPPNPAPVPQAPSPQAPSHPQFTAPQLAPPAGPRIAPPAPTLAPEQGHSEFAPAPSEVPSGLEYGPSAEQSYAQAPGYVPTRGYQPNEGVDPSLYYAEGGSYGGRYPNPVGSPYYHSPNWNYGGGNGYEVHFGPGYYRSSEYGHLRYPFYSYRRPWFHPGPAVYVRDTNLHW